jgi:hypothetical protein
MGIGATDMTDTTQPEALRLADELAHGYPLALDAMSAAAELRRLHARVTELEAQAPAVPAVASQEFEQWVAAYSTLPVTRDQHAYTDMTTEILWHAWQAATKTKAPVGAFDGVIDANTRPGLAGVEYTCAHDFAVQPSSGIKLCQKCGLSEVAARKAAPQPEAAPAVWKDRDTAKLVNDLRDVAIQYHGSQQLRERIAYLVRPLVAPQPEAAAGPTIDYGQFLSDVMTAAGLVAHGKQCKALSDRLGDMVMRLRAAPQPEAAAMTRREQAAQRVREAMGIDPSDVTDPLHPRYITGFNAGHAAGKKRAHPHQRGSLLDGSGAGKTKALTQ